MASSVPASEFSSADKLGLSFIAAGGSISLCCVTGIILYTVIKRSQGKHYASDVSNSNLFLSLMVADLIYALGTMLNIKWAVEGTVTEGKLCTTQAILKQIGNNGISFTSLAITINTFFVLVLFREPGKFTSKWVIVTIWLCTGLVVAIPNIVQRDNPDAYYGDTGFWCFITSNYTTERLVTDYVWAWLTGLVMIILYPIMAVVVCCWARGSINQTVHAAVGKKLLLFPIAYNLCILPNSVSRWLSFTNHNVPDKVILASNALHAFSGFFDFVVFCITRPAMVFGIRRDSISRHSYSISRISTLRPTSINTIDTPRADLSSPQTDTTDQSLHMGRSVISDEVLIIGRKDDVDY